MNSHGELPSKTENIVRSEFKKIQFDQRSNNLHTELYLEMLYGANLVEIDRASFDFAKEQFKNSLFFELSDCFAILLGRLKGGTPIFAEFLSIDTRFFLRPPNAKQWENSEFAP
jgi:hypothetical protein